MARGPSHFQPFDVVRFPPARILLFPSFPRSMCSICVYLSLSRAAQSRKQNVTLLKFIEKDDVARQGIRKAPAALRRAANTPEHAHAMAHLMTRLRRQTRREKLDRFCGRRAL